MGLDFDYTGGQTPLDDEERDGLLIPTISTRGELDEFEQQNIEDVLLWLMRKSLNADNILSEAFIRELHKRMFGKVWSWAGQFRKTEKNLGIAFWQIPVALKGLCDDAQYWIAHQTYSPDEIALRFKHRIVCIHCFSNGNGRHSRLMADVIIEKIFKQAVFNWGEWDLVHPSETRATYLSAIREADLGNYLPLIQFARSLKEGDV